MVCTPNPYSLQAYDDRLRAEQAAAEAAKAAEEQRTKSYKNQLQYKMELQVGPTIAS